MIWRMNADIGKIFVLLKELNLDDDTIVIFTSDNGPQGKDEGGYDQTFFNSNGGLRGIKRELYEGGYAQAVRIGRWKAARHGLNGSIELYDLQTDPKEMNNLAAKQPALIKRIEEIMKREHVESEHWSDR